MQSLFDSCKMKVKDIYNQFDASHDFDHIQRVLRNAERILEKESEANPDIVRLAVLLHDIEDAKYKSMHTVTVKEILVSNGADEKLTQQVLDCIETVSFSGGNSKELSSIDGAIVRDADRLDAIGAIGIARAFAFGGAKGRKLYDIEETARQKMSEAEYRGRETATVTHFHEKLLLLKDLMVTEEGRRMAEQRHQYMEGFLQQLQQEIGQ